MLLEEQLYTMLLVHGLPSSIQGSSTPQAPTLATAHSTNTTGEVLLAPVGMRPFLNLEDAGGSYSAGIV